MIAEDHKRGSKTPKTPGYLKSIMQQIDGKLELTVEGSDSREPIFNFPIFNSPNIDGFSVMAYHCGLPRVEVNWYLARACIDIHIEHFIADSNLSHKCEYVSQQVLLHFFQYLMCSFAINIPRSLTVKQFGNFGILIIKSVAFYTLELKGICEGQVDAREHDSTIKALENVTQSCEFVREALEQEKLKRLKEAQDPFVPFSSKEQKSEQTQCVQCCNESPDSFRHPVIHLPDIALPFASSQQDKRSTARRNIGRVTLPPQKIVDLKIWLGAFFQKLNTTPKSSLYFRWKNLSTN